MGMFKGLSGGTIQNLTLMDPIVDAPGWSNVGILSGGFASGSNPNEEVLTQGARISNVKILSSGATPSFLRGSNAIGAIVGNAASIFNGPTPANGGEHRISNVKIDNLSIVKDSYNYGTGRLAPTVYTQPFAGSSPASIGGVVGSGPFTHLDRVSVSNLKIQDTSASTDISIGGLMGVSTGRVQIDNSKMVSMTLLGNNKEKVNLRVGGMIGFFNPTVGTGFTMGTVASENVNRIFNSYSDVDFSTADGMTTSQCNTVVYFFDACRIGGMIGQVTYYDPSSSLGTGSSSYPMLDISNSFYSGSTNTNPAVIQGSYQFGRIIAGVDLQLNGGPDFYMNFNNSSALTDGSVGSKNIAQDVNSRTDRNLMFLEVSGVSNTYFNQNTVGSSVQSWDFSTIWQSNLSQGTPDLR
jgi:hypothetical protein